MLPDRTRQRHFDSQTSMSKRCPECGGQLDLVADEFPYPYNSYICSGCNASFPNNDNEKEEQGDSDSVDNNKESK